uniref:Uncharacterized protein n=1 Tax=Anguilla anguilla TaxID=7936 RepID=A0A0E9T6P3_ANGAN
MFCKFFSYVLSCLFLPDLLPSILILMWRRLVLGISTLMK